GLGYAHAQDRLRQMEFQRRIGNGRLSEIFGLPTIQQDRFLRTVGFGRAAREAWKRAPKWGQGPGDADCAGVNAVSAPRPRAAPGFPLVGFEPERWSGPDVIVWVKMMAWDLSANYSFELLRTDLTRAVGADRMAQLLPPYPRDGLSILEKVPVSRFPVPGSPGPGSSGPASSGPASSGPGSTPSAATDVLGAVRAALSGGNP